MKVKLFAGIFISLFISCKNLPDPTLGLEMDMPLEKWQEEIKYLETKNALFNKDEYGSYASYFLIDNDSIKVKYEFNNTFENNELMIIKVDLQGDTTCEKVNNPFFELNEAQDSLITKKTYIRGFAPRSKRDINLVRNYLFKIYGQPDSNSNQIEIEFFKRRSKKNRSLSDVEFFIENKSFKDIWIKTTYTIELHRTPPYYDQCFHDTVYHDAYILFKSRNYNKRVKEIKDEIRKNLKPNDLFRISFLPLESGKEHMIQSLNTIERIGNEEARDITDIKFDIVYSNNFNEELYRLINCTYHFTPSIKAHYGVIANNTYYDFKDTYSTQIKFIFNNPELIKIRAEIKKVAFSDGSVLQ